MSPLLTLGSGTAVGSGEPAPPRTTPPFSEACDEWDESDDCDERGDCDECDEGLREQFGEGFWERFWEDLGKVLGGVT